MQFNKAEFLFRIIGERTQDEKEACEIVSNLNKYIPGILYEFPMMWCMVGIKQDFAKKKILDGEIYFMQECIGKNIKIGFSKTVEQRKKQHEKHRSTTLRTLLTFPGNFRIENELHDLFSAFRVEGEWYSSNDATEYYIKCMRAGLSKDMNSIRDVINGLIWKMKFLPPEENEYKKIIYG